MTTIAADHRTGVMVSDSKCTHGDTWSPMTKIHRHKDEIIGLAGDIKQMARWLAWVKAGKKGAPPKLDEFQALVLRKDGLYHVTADTFEQRIERGFHAVGSGGAAATAVMLAGHDAEEAVRIACLVDAQSGGELQKLTLKE